MMKITCILGTRPEIIKLSPVIRAAREHDDVALDIVHTGQHYSYEMDGGIFADLSLPKPNYNLHVGSGSHGQQTGKMLQQLESVLSQSSPDVVLVQGDTNTVLAGALAAAKLHIPIGHVEAGLRSFNRDMPEEINRIATDHIADFLYAPTEETAAILSREGLSGDKVIVTGNTIVDAVLQNLEIAKKKARPKIMDVVGQNPFVLVTSHRAENVDDENRLTEIVSSIVDIAASFRLAVVWPLHPRTDKQLQATGLKHLLESSPSIHLTNATSFLESLYLQNAARLILTDSGGIQEEACIIGRDCLTLRDDTERPETVTVGANRLTGADKNTILEAMSDLISQKQKKWPNPFGDGHSGSRIVSHLKQSLV